MLILRMTLFRIEGVAPEDLHNWKYCKNCTKLIPFNLFSSHKEDCCNTSSSPKQVEDFKPQNPGTHNGTGDGGAGLGLLNRTISEENDI